MQDPEDSFRLLFLGNLVQLCKKACGSPVLACKCPAWAEVKSKEELVCGSMLFRNAVAQAWMVLQGLLKGQAWCQRQDKNLSVTIPSPVVL